MGSPKGEHSESNDRMSAGVGNLDLPDQSLAEMPLVA